MTATKTHRRKKHLITTAIITLITVGVLLVLTKGLTLNPSLVKSNLLGKQAAPFEVEMLESSSWLPQTSGNRLKLSDMAGKPIILNFWASWCVSCREEAIHMEAFWKRYREKGILVLGIAIQDSVDAAKEFAKVHGKTYPIAIDHSGKASIDYGVYGVPETFLIDSQGTIVHKEAGPVTALMLEELVSKYFHAPQGS
jgi:cytochrome c biogenesis protein CcmG/thiol:disulfide interchange protein DsbE